MRTNAEMAADAAMVMRGNAEIIAELAGVRAELRSLRTDFGTLIKAMRAAGALLMAGMDTIQ